MTWRMGRQSAFSRRGFLKASSAFAIGHCAVPVAAALDFPSARRVLAYVGTETSPVDSAANGKGIYLFESDVRTGELLRRGLAVATTNPSWICLHPSKRYLYSVNEVSDYHGDSGSVSAFAVDQRSGGLRPLNTVSSHGAGPTYMSLDASGRFAFVANYYGGSIAVLPILRDGLLGEAVYVHEDQGSGGSLHAADAPPGSFAISGHHIPHAHMIHADPANRFVLQTDLGQDRIYVYEFDGKTGRLTPANTPFISLPSGDGPRHFVFHPNGRWLYSIQEEASTVVFFQYDSATGLLIPQQTVSTLPPGFAGTNFCSEVMISPDGRFLYAANRLHNSIAVFSIAGNGRLRRIGEALTEGDYPNYMTLDPTGENMYVCNQRSDQITCFRVDRNNGALTFTGRYQPLGTPMCMVFLT
jgi:6-phosphogluconolactonase